MGCSVSRYPAAAFEPIPLQFDPAKCGPNAMLSNDNTSVKTRGGVVLAMSSDPCLPGHSYHWKTTTDQSGGRVSMTGVALESVKKHGEAYVRGFWGTQDDASIVNGQVHHHLKEFCKAGCVIDIEFHYQVEGRPTEILMRTTLRGKKTEQHVPLEELEGTPPLYPAVLVLTSSQTISFV
eukprot:gnl/Trimastix_PCT/1829.p1 GENE.gnl/Trimastix_PCT/1829~~gnl/Trimastix_PCT/1829.p1  ORF type:complete len:179 (-),score=13.76 gnl/Trimastix_PCT/1829:79-615(-)